MTMSIKQRKIKIEPRIKLNHNKYTCILVLGLKGLQLTTEYTVAQWINGGIENWAL